MSQEQPETDPYKIFEIPSPSGKYKLFTHMDERGNIYKGIIVNTKTGETIREIQPYYYSLDCAWFTKNGHEYLITCRNHQIFLNIDTGEELINNDTYLCYESWINPDETILVVYGCFYEEPCGYRFYDVSNLGLKDGCNVLKTDNKDNQELYLCNTIEDDEFMEPYWDDDNIFTIYSIKSYLKYDEILYSFEEDDEPYNFNSDYWEENTVYVITQIRKVTREGDTMKCIETIDYDIHTTENLDQNKYYQKNQLIKKCCKNS